VTEAQTRGELVSWVQPEDGALFPPDLDEAGVDLDSLITIHVPRHPFALVRAAEWLARSGAFGLTVIDLTDGKVVFKVCCVNTTGAFSCSLRTRMKILLPARW
jgi:RecA/RadA recombinase